jgi:protein-disulfide isomerase-like protein with CxxC motif
VWDSLAVELEGEIYVAKVNGPKHKALAKRLHVKAYPTILYLRDGEMREYAASRTLAQLASFGRKSWRGCTS